MALPGLRSRRILCAWTQKSILQSCQVSIKFPQYTSNQVAYDLDEKKEILAPRTPISNPNEHEPGHVGMWYTIPEAKTLQLFTQHHGLQRSMKTQWEVFEEAGLMIRKPALTAIDIVRRSNLSLPPTKVMLYGKNGTGKSTSLMHILHYLSEEGWMILHFGKVTRYRRTVRDMVPSPSVPGRFDSPNEAAEWLLHFRNLNAPLLKSLELTVSRDYAWTKREMTAAGEPLTAVIEQGLNRNRFAPDAMLHLIGEIKEQASLGKFKLAVVIDGINGLFCPLTFYKTEDGIVPPLDKYTIFQSINQIMDNNWKNGVMIGSLDTRANEPGRMESHLPRYLLRKKGWENLDPFIPIPVEEYSESEINSALDYYTEREWLQHPAARTDMGRRELISLSSYNPRHLRLCVRGL